jgi:hypothetical protein
MELPIDTNKISLIIIGEAMKVLVYGTNEAKRDADGKEVFKVPVLLQITGAKQDATTTITVSGEVNNLPKGQRAQATGLTILTWSLRGKDGNMRNGVTLRAKTLTVFPK